MLIYICTSCGSQSGRTDVPCVKCGSRRFEERSADSIQRHVPEKVRKAAHEQTYYAIEREHGKDVASRFWQRRKNAY